ncbi:mannose-1-phosphateguanylyltransferase/mannose-6-phosphate isomerase PslB [Striga asiatica]|uniref:Mannose-1-phosphateguanylyltransferase/mannose-6-phosphate isomerase PslB n=1 Tax=Striga asiatica TaxID=4170 RepID=A0A5A7PAV3_STRAF|nr:mannose-1-phosphateguanylyltransferase/mannose-6-phosphate isomerase PslB [Striga asiatica]
MLLAGNRLLPVYQKKVSQPLDKAASGQVLFGLLQSRRSSILTRRQLVALRRCEWLASSLVAFESPACAGLLAVGLMLLVFAWNLEPLIAGGAWHVEGTWNILGL